MRALLRFITCGSVDDGKSTLIGRLLADAGRLADDQLAALAADSRRYGTRGGEIDYALLVDGLTAEREQGITIDVAYRFFSTDRRSFIVADTPGHEQYTRNMATGASTADVAVILVDAAKGLLTQTRRHSHLVALLGIRHVVLAVNKMDLVEFSAARFEALLAEYRRFAAPLCFDSLAAIPLCAVDGDNVTQGSARMPWYSGPSLLGCLEEIDVQTGPRAAPFRMPVQWVSRPHADYRGLCGLIATGAVKVGDPVRVLPSGRDTTVAEVCVGEAEVAAAAAGESVSIRLADAVDVGRGDWLVAADSPAAVADGFEATVIWMHDEPLLQGRAYLLKSATRTVMATVAPIKYRVDVNSGERLAAKRLELNDIGVCGLELDAAIPFEPYSAHRDLGGAILIDRLTQQTVGAVLLHFALHRSQNVQWQTLDVDKAARARQNRQRPCILWFTGLSGAGKSTIANLVEKRLYAEGHRSYLLDGDNVRHGLNKDLGFTAQDRVENVRRVAEVARLMMDAGLIVLVSFISPFRSERRMARALVQPGEFVEVYVDTPLAVAEARDPKGLYAKARRGDIKNFTGIDSPYEAPESPEIRLDTARVSAEESAALIVEYLRAANVFS